MRPGRRALRHSLGALRTHTLRTTLALVGVSLGTAGMLLTSAVGKGAEAQVRQELEAAGPNLLVVRPRQVKRSAMRRQLRGVVTSLCLEDYRAILALPIALEAAPAVDAGLRLRVAGGSLAGSVVGSVPALARLRNLRIQDGRFFDEGDDSAAQRVAVLGARVAGTLFPAGDAVGRDVRLRGQAFEVIGVLRSRGIEPDGSDQDGNVFVPMRTALRRLFNSTWVTAVFISVEDRAQMPAATAALRELLRDRHRLLPGAPDDFEVQDQARLLALQQDAVRGLTLLTAGLAAVALLVGGAGILALMFLSVKERTAEIGLRRAVGARPRDVLAQFLAEAAALALGGWAAGLALALFGGLGLALGTAWKVALPVEAVLESFALALATGVAGGAVPARQASLVTPVRALASAG